MSAVHRSIHLASLLSIWIYPAFVFSPVAKAQHLLSKPVWEPSPIESLNPSIQWTSVEDYGSLPTQFQPAPAKFDPKELAAKPRVEGPYKSRGIYGFGAGVRPGVYTGDPTNALFTARLGYKLNQDISLSLRPSFLIGNGNQNDNNFSNGSGNETELRLPLTLDLFNRSLITPFVGGGLATNVDGLGYTDGMLTAGVDLNLTKWLTIGSNINYIYQTNINDTDWEVLSMLYLRF